MTTGGNEAVLIRGHQELYERTWHLFTSARREIACAAHDLHTWVSAGALGPPPHSATLPVAGVRKLYRPGVLLDPAGAQHARRMAGLGAQVRITSDEINETILIDRRVAILAGDTAHGPRSFTVVRLPDVVAAVGSLFDAAWRAATELDAYDAQFGELRRLAPRILELLGSGCKDETAARTLSLSVRTYRRRVAELMTALGATSRFQAGARARELGLV
ncbi:MAG TPA: DNA-binding response regulator [Actinophytocola sp.]|uniref:DNA-binding response regulator n=1 Tax=Actinophytocola sp. TaxID=1872138 RepID=UPI002DBB8BF1|nr:DNA-binding response regulator [Actinophytocola sp.]HEU5469798.1 DNA-binding response regulator [Actinophytocola sp.]